MDFRKFGLKFSQEMKLLFRKDKTSPQQIIKVDVIGGQVRPESVIQARPKPKKRKCYLLNLWAGLGYHRPDRAELHK